MSFIGVYLILIALPSAQIFGLPGHPTPRLVPLDVLAENSEIVEDGRPLWGGDMRLTDDQIDILINGVSERGAAVKSLSNRWPGGQIPYKIDPSASAAKGSIEGGMKFWSDNTCVSFNPVPDIPNQPYLNIMHTGKGCWSYVGIITNGPNPQTVSIDYSGCASCPIVAHELGHAMGLWHEQDRLDRDDYLTVYINNTGKNKEIFDCQSDVMHYDVPYDYGSIMQYSIDGFSTNGRLVLVPKDPLAEMVMSKAEEPSFYDYKIINRMYNCSANCNLDCMNGGYAASNKVKGCRCECPPGLSGDKCQTRVDVAIPPCGGGRITTEQTISTPDFPCNRPSNLQCAWLIEAPNGKYAQIIVKDFDLSQNENSCPWDQFKIRLNDLQSDDPGKTYCGTELAGKTITSASHQMLIVLNTGTHGWGRGFQADVRFTTQK